MFSHRIFAHSNLHFIRDSISHFRFFALRILYDSSAVHVRRRHRVSRGRLCQHSAADVTDLSKLQKPYTRFRKFWWISWILISRPTRPRRKPANTVGSVQWPQDTTDRHRTLFLVIF